jgi:hypothetical protein
MKQLTWILGLFVFGVFIAGAVAEEATPMLISANTGDAKAIAEAYVKETAIFKAKGSDLTFVKEEETAAGTAYTFTYLARDNGFSAQVSYYYAKSAVKNTFTRTIAVTVKDGKVVAAVLDSKWDEANQKFLTSSRFQATTRGTLTSSKASLRPSNQAQAIAEAWVKQAPTYKGDGFGLSFVEWKTDVLNANRYIIILAFKTRHPGYGARATYAANQATGHRIEVKVEGGKVVSAIIDEKWDEMTQKESTANKKIGLVTMSYQPKQCAVTPWQEWYTSNKNRFSVKPAEESLIAAYYTTVYSYQITNVNKVMAAGVVCSACQCPTGYYFTTQIRARDEARLKNNGWILV